MYRQRISIVVPFYNSEQHIEKCIESILGQTEKEFELILVDDGSTDKSGIICDQYKKIDKRVNVIHQKNSGVSAARNAGIKAASGEFIGFVDSDDWIDAQMFSDMLSYAQSHNADVIMCDARTVFSDGTTESDTITLLNKSNILFKSDFYPELLLEMAGSACRCLYKSDLIKTNNIYFPEGIKFSEDRIFNIYAFGYANKISYIKIPYYNRFMNKKSAVNRFHSDYYDAVKNAHIKTQEALKKIWNGEEKYTNAYLKQFIIGSLSAINNYYYKTSTFSTKERFEAVRVLCSQKEFIDAIKESNFKDIRSKWVLRKWYLLLIIYAKLFNLKNHK